MISYLFSGKIVVVNKFSDIKRKTKIFKNVQKCRVSLKYSHHLDNQK